MSKWCVFAAVRGGVCVPALEQPSDERARGNRHSAASETSLALRQLEEEAWTPREGCYCSAWLNKRRDEVGRLTDEVGTSQVSMHWSSGELQLVKQTTAPRSPPPPQLSTIYYTPVSPKLQMLSLLPSHEAFICTPMSEQREHPPAHLSWTHYCIDCLSSGAYHIKAGIIKCQFLKLWLLKKGVKVVQRASSWGDIKASPSPQAASILKQILLPGRFQEIHFHARENQLDSFKWQ